MTAHDPGLWGGRTAGDRAAERRDRLMTAAMELIGEKGVGGLTVRELYARARLNPRYFYESFADLDALLSAMFDDLLTTILARVLAALAAAPDDERAKTRAAIGAAFGYLTEDPRRIQVLFSDALGHPALAARRRDLIRTAADGMADQAAGFYGIPADAPLLRSTTYMLAGGLAELLIAWHNGTLEVTVTELTDDAAALVSGLGDAARAIGAQRGRD